MAGSTAKAAAKSFASIPRYCRATRSNSPFNTSGMASACVFLRIATRRNAHHIVREARKEFGTDRPGDVRIILQKIYGNEPQGERRYSPAVCLGAQKREITGNPDPKHISTSFVERQNLTMRMHMRRFTRLTNGFWKKFENHVYIVALYTVWYNFVKQHKSLKGLSPAMAGGLSDTLWSMTDLAEMVDAAHPKPTQRGPYKKRATA
jgi:hypothetical protein